jgi:hypothetical protein
MGKLWEWFDPERLFTHATEPFSRFFNNLEFRTNMAITRSKWNVLDFLLKRSASTKEILAHFPGASMAIVMIYVESLQKEHSIELRDDRRAL